MISFQAVVQPEDGVVGRSDHGELEWSEVGDVINEGI